MSTPNPTYGFELCSADDPNRTDFWCPHCCEWSPKAWVACSDSGCGKTFRKPIELPVVLKDEWEIVPESEFATCVPEDGAYKFKTDDMTVFMPLANHGSALTRWVEFFKKPVVFIRRKSQPVSAVESGAEVGRWVSVKDAIPPKGSNLCFTGVPRVFDCDGTDHLVKYYGVTHWMPLPNPPAPEKTPAELAWDAHINEVSYRDDLEEIAKDAFLAGYAKGAAN